MRFCLRRYLLLTAPAGVTGFPIVVPGSCGTVVDVGAGGTAAGVGAGGVAAGGAVAGVGGVTPPFLTMALSWSISRCLSAGFT